MNRHLLASPRRTASSVALAALIALAPSARAQEIATIGVPTNDPVIQRI